MPKPSDAMLRWLRSASQDGFLHMNDDVCDGDLCDVCQMCGLVDPVRAPTAGLLYGYRLTDAGRAVLEQAEREGR